MAKRLAIPSEELKLRLVGAYDNYMVARVQRLTINKDIPTTDIYEIGSNTLAGTVTDIPAVTLTFSVFDVGIRAFSVLTGTDPTAYPAAGVDISELGEVDAIIYVKDASLTDYIKSAHAKRLQVRDFSYSFSVDGEATEDYTLIGSESRWFKNDVVVDRFAYTVPGVVAWTASAVPLVLANGNNALTVILNGEYLTTEVVGAPAAAGEYRFTTPAKVLTVFTALAVGQSVTVIYHATDGGTTWSYISETDVPAAVRGQSIKIEIKTLDIARVQNVTINGNLNTQAVKEMGNKAIVGYQRQVPTVDGTLAVLDTDTELIDLLLNGSISSGDTEFEIGSECVASGVDLEVLIYDPCDDASLLKTIYIPELVLTGDSYASTVNQNATHTFNWKSNTAECLVYSGAK